MTPPTRLRNLDDASKQGLHPHALPDFLKAWMNPVLLYSRVAQLLEQARKDGESA